MRSLLLTILAMLLLNPTTSPSATIHVPADQPTIQAGIDAASYGDTVLVACGTYYEYEIIMKNGITLRSETGQPQCVSIDAQQLGTAVVCWGEDETTSIEGFTITGGSEILGRFMGGGMQVRGSLLTIRDCRFYGNTASHGGGMSCWIGSPTIIDCAFENNTATRKGAGVHCADATPNLINCVFSGNSGAEWGGAMCCSFASPTLTNCIFSWNSAGEAGGAIFCDESAAAAMRCTFFANSADYGGGLFGWRSSALALHNTIIAASPLGAGVGCGVGSHATLTCCDVWGNVGGDWVDGIADQYGINGNISEDPLFCAPHDGDFHIECLSPCAPAQQPRCGLIGALGVGCGPAATVPSTWGLVKSIFQLPGGR